MKFDTLKDIADTKIDTNSKLAETGKKIIELLRFDGKRTQQMISEELGVPLRAVKRIMTTIKENRIIEHVGSKKGGYWKVNKN